ncbi:MAG: CapA family protein [Armatimonadetes bacterium]|nr:CapA family protein [Armatimonadota bacterium]
MTFRRWGIFALLGVMAAAFAWPASAASPRRFSLVAVGDIMLDRGVGRAIQRRGWSSIFACVRDRLRAADITFGNLESPLSTRGAHSPKDCVFRAHPSTVKVLLDGGFDIVSVANNHTLNSGRQTLLDTLGILRSNGLRYVGARPERHLSWWPVHLQAGGLTVGFMAFTDLSFEHGSYSKVDKDLGKFAEKISTAARKVDVLVVSFHWGEEYMAMPTLRQRQVARVTVEAGADLILGHHPHVLQGITALNGAPILYSMGNFVFDQRQGERMESAIFELSYVAGDGWYIRAVPVIIPSSRFGPEYPPTTRSQKIAWRLAELSAKLGTYPKVASDNAVILHVASRDDVSLAQYRSN